MRRRCEASWGYGADQYIADAVSQMALSQLLRAHSVSDLAAEQALNCPVAGCARSADSVSRRPLPTLTPDSARESDQIRLPFGEGKTSPVAMEDVARAIAALLANPRPARSGQDLSRGSVRSPERSISLCERCIARRRCRRHYLSGHPGSSHGGDEPSKRPAGHGSPIAVFAVWRSISMKRHLAT